MMQKNEWYALERLHIYSPNLNTHCNIILYLSSIYEFRTKKQGEKYMWKWKFIVKSFSLTIKLLVNFSMCLSKLEFFLIELFSSGLHHLQSSSSSILVTEANLCSTNGEEKRNKSKCCTNYQETWIIIILFCTVGMRLKLFDWNFSSIM